MGRVTPTQRSLAHLKRAGWTCGVVERWIPKPTHPGGGFRKDFCGGIDLIAFRSWRDPPMMLSGSVDLRSDGILPLEAHSGGGIVGVQCCSASSLADHRAKLLAEPRMREWVASGARLVIHAWRKVNERKIGKRKLWQVNEVELRLSDFAELHRIVATSSLAP